MIVGKNATLMMAEPGKPFAPVLHDAIENVPDDIKGSSHMRHKPIEMEFKVKWTRSSLVIFRLLATGRYGIGSRLPRGVRGYK